LKNNSEHQRAIGAHYLNKTLSEALRSSCLHHSESEPSSLTPKVGMISNSLLFNILMSSAQFEHSFGLYYKPYYVVISTVLPLVALLWGSVDRIMLGPKICENRFRFG